VENSLSSYRSIVEVPLHRNVSEVVIPGVLRKYDVADLLLALAPGAVIVVNPVDGAGVPVTGPLVGAEHVPVRSRQAGQPLIW
jgi:hypothetical protein